LGHPDIQAVDSSIGLNLDEVKVAMYILENMKKMIAAIYDKCKSSKCGQMHTDAHSFLSAIATCIVETPPPLPDSATKKPAKKERGKKLTKISHQKLQKALGWSSRGQPIVLLRTERKQGRGCARVTSQP